jgi:hypothetical protein
VFFFDEVRLGTKPVFGKRWTGKGEHPVAVVRSGYRSFYTKSR